MQDLLKTEKVYHMEYQGDMCNYDRLTKGNNRYHAATILLFYIK
jgi:hypothetical protein